MDNARDMYLGYGFSSSFYLDGVQDEVMVFDGGLTAIQAMDLYRLTRQGKL